MGGPKGKEYKDHLRTLEDIFNIFNWFTLDLNGEDGLAYFDDCFGSIDFSKVRGKDGLDKTWF